jgi:hypothetical protein
MFFSDWTIQTHPTPAHPSYRLISALRLFHVVEDCSMSEIPYNMELQVMVWRDTIQGTRDNINQRNEEAWRATLRKLCQQMGESSRQRVKDLPTMLDPQYPSWGRGALRDLRRLYQEEECVALAVIGSLDQNEEF